MRGLAREAAEAVARRSYGKLVALLAARTRDVAGAEDALSDAFASALIDWPVRGVPRDSGGLAVDCGAAQVDRRGSTAPQCRGRRRAEGLLSRASAMPGTGRYQLEAAVQSAHVVRRLIGRCDWPAIERIYDALLAMTGSPVVAINRAIAMAETRGPAAGLEALDALSGDRRLAEYQPYWAAHAGLLARTGEVEAAEGAYERAIGLESDPAVRRFLQRRRAELRGLSRAGAAAAGAPPSRTR